MKDAKEAAVNAVNAVTEDAAAKKEAAEKVVVKLDGTKPEIML